MKQIILVVLMGALLLTTFTVIDLDKRLSREKILTASLEDQVFNLRALKAHFYDFRERVMSTIPVDYLSEVTLGDFDFDKYLEDE